MHSYERKTSEVKRERFAITARFERADYMRTRSRVQKIPSRNEARNSSLSRAFGLVFFLVLLHA
jgi:hypothetical protein